MKCNFVVQEEALEAAVRSSIVEHMVMVHQSVRTFSARFLDQLRRYNYVTPRNYLDFIHNYKHALADNRSTFSSMAARLDGGLQKLIQVKRQLPVLLYTAVQPSNHNSVCERHSKQVLRMQLASILLSAL